MQLGPASIYRDRFDYGESWKQQALLNIVKMSCVRELATNGATGCAAGVNQFLRNESAVMSAVEHAKLAQKAVG